MEASDRPKQAQHLPTCRKVQNENFRVHQGLSDSMGVGVVNRPIRHLPSHSHPPKLKEVPKVLPQVTGVSVYIPSVRPSHGPTGLYNDRKGNEADDPDKRNQSSPIPGRLAYQGPVSERSTSKHLDIGRHDTVLRVDNKSREIRTQIYSGIFVCALRIPPRLSPCKTHARDMAQPSGFDPTLKVKACKMSPNVLLASMEKMVLEGRLHMRPFQFH